MKLNKISIEDMHDRAKKIIEISGKSVTKTFSTDVKPSFLIYGRLCDELKYIIHFYIFLLNLYLFQEFQVKIKYVLLLDDYR